MPDDLTNRPCDWYHVNDKVYEAIAGYVVLQVRGKLPPAGRKMTYWS